MESSTPSTARVHDALPDGTHHVEVDRALRDEILRTAPELRQVAQAVRTWQARVVRHLAGLGITQFLDVGSGPTTREATHLVARKTGREVSVVYVVPEAGGQLVPDDRTALTVAAPTRPAEVFNSPAVRERLDLDRPVALLHCTSLHHVADEQDPAGIVAGYAERLAPGSHVALAHWWDPEDEGVGSSLARRIEGIHRSSSTVATARYRTRAEIEALFDGLEFLRPTADAPPSLAPLHRWWPDGSQPEDPPLISRLVLGGIGRKP